MNFIKELLEEMKDVDPTTINVGEEDPEENQTVVGTMSDDARKIWGVLTKTADKAKPLAEEFVKEVVGSDRYNELKKELENLRLRTGAIKEIFWTTIRLEFPELQGKHHIGICKGSRIFWEPCNCHQHMGFSIITLGSGGFGNLFDDIFRA